MPLEVTEEEASAEGRRDLRGAAAGHHRRGGRARLRRRGLRRAARAAAGGWWSRSPTSPTTSARAPRSTPRRSARATSVYLPGPGAPDAARAALERDLLAPARRGPALHGRGHADRPRRQAHAATELYPGVMRSAARCTYDEVQAVLDGEDVPHRNRFKAAVRAAEGARAALHQMRIERGAIDFDLPEHKVLMDEDGRPARMVQRERKVSHRLIEECMLAANEAVAQFFQEQALPSIYRFHGEPDEEKLDRLLAARRDARLLPRRSGRDLVEGAERRSSSKLEGHPEKRALNQLLLRSMMQAVYSAENVGHYGLAAEHYLHFTSPIRRYPDLIVHRLLKEHWARKEPRGRRTSVERETERLERMAEQSSERERAAMQVEREVVSFYAALLMEDRVGEEFGATVVVGHRLRVLRRARRGVHRGPGRRPRRSARASSSTRSCTRSSTRAGGGCGSARRCSVRLVSVSRARRQLDFEAIAFEGEARLPGAGEEGSSVDFVQRFKRKAGTKGAVPGRGRPVRRGGGEAPVRRGGGKSFERPAGRGRAQEPAAFERARRGAAEEPEAPRRSSVRRGAGRLRSPRRRRGSSDLLDVGRLRSPRRRGRSSVRRAVGRLRTSRRRSRSNGQCGAAPPRSSRHPRRSSGRRAAVTARGPRARASPGRPSERVGSPRPSSRPSVRAGAVLPPRSSARASGPVGGRGARRPPRSGRCVRAAGSSARRGGDLERLSAPGLRSAPRARGEEGPALRSELGTLRAVPREGRSEVRPPRQALWQEARSRPAVAGRATRSGAAAGLRPVA